MTDPSQSPPSAGSGEWVTTFVRGKLNLRVVTLAPLSPDEVHALERALPKSGSVELFAEIVSTVLGRHVRIRDERPSPDIRLEVGR